MPPEKPYVTRFLDGLYRVVMGLQPDFTWFYRVAMRLYIVLIRFHKVLWGIIGVVWV